MLACPNGWPRRRNTHRVSSLWRQMEPEREHMPLVLPGHDDHGAVRVLARSQKRPVLGRKGAYGALALRSRAGPVVIPLVRRLIARSVADGWTGIFRLVPGACVEPPVSLGEHGRGLVHYTRVSMATIVALSLPGCEAGLI
jgi:hypothetical protein